MTTEHREGGAEGGDPVCWMHLLCPACGAMPDPEEHDEDGRPSSGTCPRCGEERAG